MLLKQLLLSAWSAESCADFVTMRTTITINDASIQNNIFMQEIISPSQ